MRTTVRLDEVLMRDVKRYAARHQRTFTSVVEDALRKLLNEERQRESGADVDVVVFTGSGLCADIDIADRGTWEPVLDAEDAKRLMAAVDADS